MAIPYIFGTLLLLLCVTTCYCGNTVHYIIDFYVGGSDQSNGNSGVKFKIYGPKGSTGIGEYENRMKIRDKPYTKKEFNDDTDVEDITCLKLFARSKADLMITKIEVKKENDAFTTLQNLDSTWISTEKKSSLLLCKCEDGKYASLSGSGYVCEDCPINTKSTVNHQECESCQPGYVSTKGSSECKMCPANTYSTTDYSCKNCPINHFSNPGSTSSLACKKACTLNNEEWSNIDFSATENKINPGTVISITCDPGYTIDGSDMITCVEDKTFSTKPTCQPDCERPNVDNGNVKPVGTKVKYGEKVTLECNTHYTMFGRGVIECQKKGKLNNLPICISNYCKTNTLEPLAILEPKLPVRNGTKVTVSCPENYNLTGDTTVTCLNDNLKYNSPPQCKNITRSNITIYIILGSVSGVIVLIMGVVLLKVRQRTVNEKKQNEMELPCITPPAAPIPGKYNFDFLEVDTYNTLCPDRTCEPAGGSYTRLNKQNKPVTGRLELEIYNNLNISSDKDLNISKDTDDLYSQVNKENKRNIPLEQDLYNTLNPDHTLAITPHQDSSYNTLCRGKSPARRMDKDMIISNVVPDEDDQNVIYSQVNKENKSQQRPTKTSTYGEEDLYSDVVTKQRDDSDEVLYADVTFVRK